MRKFRILKGCRGSYKCKIWDDDSFEYSMKGIVYKSICLPWKQVDPGESARLNINAAMKTRKKTLSFHHWIRKQSLNTRAG